MDKETNLILTSGEKEEEYLICRSKNCFGLSHVPASTNVARPSPPSKVVIVKDVDLQHHAQTMSLMCGAHDPGGCGDRDRALQITKVLTAFEFRKPERTFQSTQTSSGPSKSGSLSCISRTVDCRTRSERSWKSADAYADDRTRARFAGKLHTQG